MDMETPKLKSFWERKEGFTGMLFLGLGALAGGFALWSALPTLIAFATGTIHLAILLGVIAAILAVVTDARFWAISSSVFQSLMRFITGLIVEIDPVGICKNYIKQLEKKRENINHEMENLKAQKNSIEAAIRDATNKMSTALATARAAKAKGLTDDAGVNALEAQRQKDFIEKMQFILEKINMLYAMLDKVEKNCETIIKDTTNQVNAKERERAMWKATSGAIKSASSILMGNSQERALFEAGMESITEDIARKNGELDRFVDRSKTILSNMDLQNGIMKEKGMELLKEFENSSGSLLISDKDMKRILADNSFSVTPKKKSADVSVL
jgi:hypothetical protein